MVLMGGGKGSMLNLLFPNQSMVVFPGQTFMKSTETLKGSKAAFVSRIPAYPRMGLRLWKTNLTAPSASPLPKKAIVDIRTFTIQVSVEY